MAVAVVALAVVALAESERDLYEILGIQRDATENDVKKAYRAQSLKFHPDKNINDPKAAEGRFLEVADSYQVLSDPKKRALYDKGGLAAIEEEQRQQHTSQSAQQAFANFNDLFSALFGAQFGGGGHFGGPHGQQKDAKPEGVWELVGAGCCDNNYTDEVSSNPVGGLEACQRRCEQNGDCEYAVHGWPHAPHWCTLLKQCTEPLKTGADDCGSRGDNGVKTYRLAEFFGVADEM